MNFYKSKLFGINVRDQWLQQTTEFLNCRVGVLPFIYLGLPIGANANRKVTWQLVIDKIRNRLVSWSSSHLSLGGKIILLKSVLFALPVYYLSFFKVSVGVANVIESMFQRFLWGSSDNLRKIHWVAW